MDRESLAVLLDQGLSVEKIARRFGKHPTTVSYWMAKYELVAVNRDKYVAKGGIDPERLTALVEAGMTISEIARDAGRSKGTVRYWLRKYGLRTDDARTRHRGETTHASKDAGLLTVRMRCNRHGDTDFTLEGRGYYRCKRCRIEAVARHRRKVKEILVEEAGSSCCICGYDRCLAALEFHHVDPTNKVTDVSANGVTLALDAARLEARKCVLLCSNCHAEVENGVASLPAKVRNTLAPANAP